MQIGAVLGMSQRAISEYANLLNCLRFKLCSCIKRVGKALAANSHAQISFPIQLNERRALKAAFFALGGFPNVLGAIDCFHLFSTFFCVKLVVGNSLIKSVIKEAHLVFSALTVSGVWREASKHLYFRQPIRLDAYTSPSQTFQFN